MAAGVLGWGVGCGRGVDSVSTVPWRPWTQPTPPHNSTAGMHENWAWYILAIGVLICFAAVVIWL